MTAPRVPSAELRAPRRPAPAAASILLAALLALAAAAIGGASQARAATLPAAEVRDKIQGGWVGGVVGAAWGYPVEFRFNGRIVPRRRVPRFSMRYTNDFTFHQRRGGPDDSYAEIPFLRALEADVHAGWPEWGANFRRTRFKLFAENNRARMNLRRGIAAPGSGDYTHNPFAYNIGWQVESDFAGLVAPAQPGAAVDISWRAGHVVGYGDGVYGGVMVAAMHAEAFRADSLDEVIEAGRNAVPAGTAYRRMIEDVLRWHERFPGNWKRTWRRLERRWNAHRLSAKRDPRHVRREFNIDSKLNGGYVLLGLLYGRGDFARTIRIAMRAGQDADSNPSTAANILGSWLGHDRIPRRFTRGLAYRRPFEGTGYTLRRAIDATVAVAREVTLVGGGSVSAGSWETPASPLVTPIGEQWPLKRTARPRIIATAAVSGLDVDFAAAAEDPDGIRDIRWSFGDLSSSAEAAPEHTYRAPGTYRATVWAVDGRGRTGFRVLTVTVG